MEGPPNYSFSERLYFDKRKANSFFREPESAKEIFLKCQIKVEKFFILLTDIF